MEPILNTNSTEPTASTFTQTSSPAPIYTEAKICSGNNSDPGVDDCLPANQLYDHLLRTIAISVQAVCMLVTLLLAFLVFRYRKYKAIAGSAWVLLELMLVGALLLYSIVVVRYFESSADLCLLEPWLRELGFTCCYGSIILKVYRLLVEFRTRKAHRWVVREKDLLKYWAVMITCVSVYLACGTISTLEHSEQSDHLMWKVWNSVNHPATAPPSLPAYVNQSRSHLLFPKSIKGDSSGMIASRSGSKARADGPRSWSTNASFLLQKARVLRRGAEIDSPSIMNNGNDTLMIMDPSESTSKTFFLASMANMSATEDGLEIVSYSAEDYQNHNQTNKPCDSVELPGMNSLLYVRFQVNSGSFFTVCRQLWWHYVNMAGEFLFLVCGLYISSSARNAASHHGEKLCLFLAIFVEFCASVAYTVLSRIAWITDYPDHLFLLEFARSQLATTLVLIIIFAPKMFFVCRQSSNKDLQRMQHQTSQIESGIGIGGLLDRVQIPVDSEMFKNPDGTAGAGSNVAGMNSANGEVDLIGNVDLSQMDPEVIREELKRVYTQLHVLKMKTLRKDNPHISKRRGGRKPPHRRFSLQRSRVQREKSKSNRTVRKPDNVEETGVEESVCSVDAASTVHQHQHQQPIQQIQQQIQQSNPSESTELTTDINPLPMPATKTIAKF